MGELFGTDGIRGVAGEYPMTSDIAEKTGWALAVYITENSLPGKVVIGRDTRESGVMFEDALIRGITSKGIDALAAGIMPTPGIAHLTNKLSAGAGIVVSASHNPYYDNGIKLFDRDGFKFSDKTESDFEKMILKSPDISRDNTNSSVRKSSLANGDMQYVSFLKSALDTSRPFEQLNMVMDCSNGATYKIAPQLFSDLGANVQTVFNTPNGRNINDGCGSQHTELLAHKVVESSADVGIAFDGDGDRLIAIDENGAKLTGDCVLAICAHAMKRDGILENNMVVSTVMSNMGLNVCLKQMGIQHVQSDVGDRYVVELMRKNNAILGGEDSGHMIFLNHHTTGDGILSAMKLMEIMVKSSCTLSQLSAVMTVYPQVLLNVSVKSKPELTTIPEINAAIQSAENKLDGKGRVLVRYSGTEPFCRVMVEAQSESDASASARYISDIIKDNIGA